MRAFNLEEAKAGKPIVTRDGRDAKFIAYVDDAKETQKVVVLANGNIIACSDSGRWLLGKECNDDLFMKIVKKTFYVNIWGYTDGLSCSKKPWATKEEALSQVTSGVEWFAKAVPIEIEE